MPGKPRRMVRGERVMQEERRYFRFEPLTVRAAARVVYLEQTGRLPLRDVRFYLRELSVMEPRAGGRARHRLRQLAERRAALGHTGVTLPARRRRQPARAYAGAAGAAP